RGAGEVEPVQQVALAEEIALGRVDVLRAQRVVFVELPRLEATHPPARVGEREHQPAREVVVAAAVDQAGADELAAREALAGRRPGGSRPARREAEPELTAYLLPQAAAGQVVARERAALGLPQMPLVERGRAVEQLKEALAAFARAVLLGRGLLVLE